MFKPNSTNFGNLRKTSEKRFNIHVKVEISEDYQKISKVLNGFSENVPKLRQKNWKTVDVLAVFGARRKI